MFYDKSVAMINSIRYANTLEKGGRNDLKKAIYESELRHIADKSFPNHTIYEQYIINGFNADCVVLNMNGIAAVGEAKTNLTASDLGAFMEATMELDCFKFVLCGRRPSPTLAKSGAWFRAKQRNIKIYNLNSELLSRFDEKLPKNKRGEIASLLRWQSEQNAIYQLSDNLAKTYNKVALAA